MVSSLFVLDVRVQLSRIAAVDVPLFRPDPLCDVGRFSQRRTLDSHTGCSNNRPMSCDVPPRLQRLVVSTASRLEYLRAAMVCGWVAAA